ncbi:MAG: hypothetical protein GY794_07685 [bacterium]|nr:hypothetical protein [bacterium]
MNRFVQQANSVIRRPGVGCGKIDDEDDDVPYVRPEGHAPQSLCECWMSRRKTEPTMQVGFGLPLRSSVRAVFWTSMTNYGLRLNDPALIQMRLPHVRGHPPERAGRYILGGNFLREYDTRVSALVFWGDGY